MTIRRVLAIIGLVGLCVVPAAGRQGSDPDVLFQAALHKEQVELQLDQAIAGYTDVVAKAGNNRALAAKALLQMAGCYEKLGRSEATEVYQRIVTQYSDSAPASVARVKLAAAAQKSPALTVRKVWDRKSSFLTAVSPDGRYITGYSGDTGDLTVRDVATGQVRDLTPSVAGKEWESFTLGSVPSPDSRSIAYYWYNNSRDRNELRVIGRDGGSARVAFPNDDDVGSLTPFGWSPDGQTIFSVMPWTEAKSPRPRWTRDIVSVPASGGPLRRIARLEGNSRMGPGGGGFNAPRDFTLSPDGRYIAYSLSGALDLNERDLHVMSVADGTSHVIAPHPADDVPLAWLPTSATLLFRSDRSGTYGIWAMQMAEGQAKGQPTLVRPDTGEVTSLGFTKSGDYYYETSSQQNEIQIATIGGATGKPADRATTLEGRYTDGLLQAVWSPDGKRIAYVQVTKLGAAKGTAASASGLASPDNSDKRLAIQTIATGEVKLLAVPMMNIARPVWLPDGSAVLVQGRHSDGRQGIFRVDVATGALAPVALAAAELNGLLYPALSGDGRTMYFRVDREGIGVRDLASGSQRMLWSDPRLPQDLALSPDDRWVAWTLATGRPDTGAYVMPTAGGEPRKLSADVSNRALAWSQDSRSLLVEKLGDPNHVILQVPIDDSAPKDTGIRAAGNVLRISVHPDGRTLALSTQTRRDETWVMPKLAAAVK